MGSCVVLYIDNVFNKVAYAVSCVGAMWVSSLQPQPWSRSNRPFEQRDHSQSGGDGHRQDLSGVARVSTRTAHQLAAELPDAVARLDRGCAEEDYSVPGVAPLASGGCSNGARPIHGTTAVLSTRRVLLDPDGCHMSLGPGGRHDVQRLAHAFKNDVSRQLSGMPSSPINGGVLLRRTDGLRGGLKLGRTYPSAPQPASMAQDRCRGP